jgi:energy-coupling factor transporter ATP-binding protein EcfA2
MQLVAICGLLALRPRILVLDEPTAQLDPQGTRLVGEALERLAATGASIVIAEHKTDLLERLAHRIVALHGGTIALDGPTAGVLGNPRLIELGVEPPPSVTLGAALAAAGIQLSPEMAR